MPSGAILRIIARKILGTLLFWKKMSCNDLVISKKEIKCISANENKNLIFT